MANNTSVTSYVVVDPAIASQKGMRGESRSVEEEADQRNTQ